jgi:hypothetical protein
MACDLRAARGALTQNAGAATKRVPKAEYIGASSVGLVASDVIHCWTYFPMQKLETNSS